MPQKSNGDQEREAATIWADEGAERREVTVERRNFEFQKAIDADKVESLIAWIRDEKVPNH